MRALDSTLERLPGQPAEIPMVSLPFENPTNILSQTKSDITTNPFVIPAKIDNKTVPQINSQVSISFIGFLDDLFNKPDDQTWINYLIIIIKKEERYNYFAVLLFFIALYILLIKN